MSKIKSAEKRAKRLFIIPSSFHAVDRQIGNTISKLVHKYGDVCCYTSAEQPDMGSMEERHVERIRKALANGDEVYAFSASTALTDLGVIQLGNLRLNATKRIEALYAAATE